MSFPPPRHLTAATTLTASTNFHHQGRPRPPFGGRGPGKPSDTLIIRKIPRELNTITKLSSHFEKFGTVVNLTVRLYQLFIVAMSDQNWHIHVHVRTSLCDI